MLLPRLGSAVWLEIAKAWFVRAPALPPGRTWTVTTGQSTPAVQTGSVAIVQDNCCAFAPEAALEHVTPVAAFATMLAEMNPWPVGPAPLFINCASVSVTDTLFVVTGPAFTTSIANVSTSPTGRVARVRVLRTLISADWPPVLPDTL